MINRKTFLAAVFLILFSVEVPGQFLGQREALRGLKTVNYTVAIDLTGLTLVSPDQLSTDVELMLPRRNTIVLSEPEAIKPTIHVLIKAIENRSYSRSLGFSVITSVELEEVVELDRDLPRTANASIWEKVALNTFSDKKSAALGIRQNVRDLVEQFSNDYLAMNPITR